MPSSYIPQDHRLAPAASVIVSDTSYASSIPRPLPTPPSLSLSPQDRLTLPTPLLSSSIPWYRKHTGASAIEDVQSEALSLLLPQPTPPFSSSRHRYHLLCRSLCRGSQSIRPVIVTPQPPPSSPNPCCVRHRLQSLGRVVYSSSSANASVVVAESA